MTPTGTLASTVEVVEALVAWPTVVLVLGVVSGLVLLLWPVRQLMVRACHGGTLTLRVGRVSLHLELPDESGGRSPSR